jgi:hypothetical protein
MAFTTFSKQKAQPFHPAGLCANFIFIIIARILEKIFPFFSQVSTTP